MKKLCAAALLAALLLCFAGGALAAEPPGTDDFARLTGTYACVTVPAFANRETLSLDAASVILVERETGAVLYEKNAEEPRAIASITKVMTILLTLEAIEQGKVHLDDVVTVSEHAYSMGGSQIWLEPGETMKVDELLRAVAVASANDAAVALAEHVAGSEEAFVAMMNRRAAELGMTGTTFKNANGLDEEGHISCARDVAIMSREVLRHELVRSYITIWTDELRGGATQLTNTNKLLRSFKGITGIKTGTTGNAGVCVSASAERDGMELIAVVLGAPDSQSRFSAARTLLEYGFANYELAAVQPDAAQLGSIAVRSGMAESCSLAYEMPQSVVVEKGKADAVRCEVSVPESVTAPVAAGQVVGEIGTFCGEEQLGSYPITAQEAVARMDFAGAFGMLLRAVLTL